MTRKPKSAAPPDDLKAILERTRDRVMAIGLIAGRNARKNVEARVTAQQCDEIVDELTDLIVTLDGEG